MQGINGWLLVYLVGSLPVVAFYAAGLSGWFFDYPLGLFFVILLVLGAPLVLLVLKLPSAPAWNIAGLWVGAGLISLRVTVGAIQADETRLTVSAIAILIAVVTIAILWAAVWTAYFLTSDRVANTFG